MDQINALIKHSKSRERYDLQEHLVQLSTAHKGYTMTQLAWLAAGGTVDAKGFCHPAEVFAMTLAFFNAKRRGCEIARNEQEEEGRRPNAKLIYGKAVCNPYEFGGAGVYPFGGSNAPKIATAVPVVAPPAPKPTGMPAELRAWMGLE